MGHFNKTELLDVYYTTQRLTSKELTKSHNILPNQMEHRFVIGKENGQRCGFPVKKRKKKIS